MANTGDLHLAANEYFLMAHGQTRSGQPPGPADLMLDINRVKRAGR